MAYTLYATIETQRINNLVNEMFYLNEVSGELDNNTNKKIETRLDVINNELKVLYRKIDE